MNTLNIVESIFFTALDKETPEVRAAYLDEACKGDANMRRCVERLLNAHPKLDGFLQQSPAAHVVDTPAPIEPPPIEERPGTIIGPYKLLQYLGEGGMGVVFMAEQEQPVRRKVALKIIKRGMDCKQVLARLEAERQVLAIMDHPNIARFLDGGTTESGRPYFVMELVKGVQIIEFCDKNRLTPRERLELFIPVCHAVQHAHQKGIIHRDIKPSNVLVTMYDDKPVPKVIDFGIAKAIEQKLTDQTLFTHVGQIVGTLQYMSPEQASFNALDVDTRADVYALGVLLYELLTGTTPLNKQQMEGVAFLEMLRLIREVDPPKPSTRLSQSGDALGSYAVDRRTDSQKLPKLVRGELDWIAMKALEKDRSRRYETANALAADVRRYLNDEIVEARPPSKWYRFQKYARRRKGELIAASIVLLVLIVGILGTSWGLVLAERERDNAIALADAKARALAFAEDETRRANDEKRKTQVQFDATLAAQKETRRANYVIAMNLIAPTWEAENVRRVRELLEEQLPKPGQEDVRGFEWHYWDHLCHAERATREVPIGRVDTQGPNGTRCFFSGDGARLVVLARDDDGTKSILRLHVVEVATGQTLAKLPAVQPTVRTVCINDDGTRVAYSYRLPASKKVTGKIAVFNVSKEEPIMELEVNGDIALSGNGRKLAVSGFKNDVTVWDLDKVKAEPRTLPETGSPARLTFSRDGKLLAGIKGEKLYVWNTESGKQVCEPFALEAGKLVNSLAFSPDGARLVGLGRPGRDDMTLYRWTFAENGDLEYKEFPVDIKGFVRPDECRPVFHPDGIRLLISGRIPRNSLIDVRTGVTLKHFKGTNSLLAAGFTADGKSLCTFAQQHPPSSLTSKKEQKQGGAYVLHEWDLAEAPQPPVFKSKIGGTPHWNADLSRALVYFPVSSRNIEMAKEENRVVHILNRQGEEMKKFAHHTGPVGDAQFSPDGRFVASYAKVDRDFEFLIWEADSLEIRWKLRVPLKADFISDRSVAFSPDGKLAAVPTVDGTAIVSMPDKSEWRGVFSVGRAADVFFSPDSKRLVVYEQKREDDSRHCDIKLWDVENRVLVRQLASVSTYYGTHFSPDSRWLVIIGDDALATIHDARTGKVQAKLGESWGPGRFIYSPTEPHVLFVPSNAKKKGATRSPVSRIDDGKPVYRLESGVSIVQAIYSPDGKRIFSAHSGAAGRLLMKVWDTATGKELLTFDGNQQRLILGSKITLKLSPDGHRLTAFSLVRNVVHEQVWDVTPRPLPVSTVK